MKKLQNHLREEHKFPNPKRPSSLRKSIFGFSCSIVSKISTLSGYLIYFFEMLLKATWLNKKRSASMLYLTFVCIALALKKVMLAGFRTNG